MRETMFDGMELTKEQARYTLNAMWMSSLNGVVTEMFNTRPDMEVTMNHLLTYIIRSSERGVLS